MKRGELYRVFKPRGEGKQFRTFVVVSRQILIDSKFPSVVCAPVMTEGQGLTTQVPIGIEEGMKRECWIHCDELRSIQKSALTRWVGILPPGKMRKLSHALAMALDLSIEVQ